MIVSKFLSLCQKIVAFPAVVLRNGLLRWNAHLTGRKQQTVREIGKVPNAAVCIFGRKKIYEENGRKGTFRALLNTERLFSTRDWRNLYSCDYTVLHYLRNDQSLTRQIAALIFSLLGKQRLYFVEPSFVSGILGYTSDTEVPVKFRPVYSYFVDDMTFYFDSVACSRVEQFLNSEAFVLGDDERRHCADLIQTIVTNKLSKYNFQPLDRPECLNVEGSKVLVVDQTFADASVWRGHGDAATFERMLDDALKENPEATIFIKTHPDRHLQARQCYYSKLPLEGTTRIVEIDVPVNPYTILNEMDAVYVCTSQLGFEALLAGKKVKTYGIPIYSGWGLTEDMVSCERRTRSRSLEEVFHALYVLFSINIDPYSLKQCPLEQYLASLLRLQAEYFASGYAHQSPHVSGSSPEQSQGHGCQPNLERLGQEQNSIT